MKKNKYLFKVGQKVITQTGFSGVITARFRHPQATETCLGYVVHLSQAFNSRPHDTTANQFVFAQYFLRAAE